MDELQPTSILVLFPQKPVLSCSVESFHLIFHVVGDIWQHNVEIRKQISKTQVVLKMLAITKEFSLPRCRDRLMRFAALVFLIKNILGQVKKNTCFSSPPASFFSAASLFLLFFYEQRFYEQKPRGVTLHTKIM